MSKTQTQIITTRTTLMLVIIASAKTQQYAPLTDIPVTQPPLIKEAETLAAHCRHYSRQEIKSIMKVSEKLTDSTIQRFQDFSTPHVRETASPALSSFAGDVFAEIKHDNFTADDFLFANERLRILSGLYGMLRPLDLMMPYRLEMGYKISLGKAASLYNFWAESVTQQLNEDLQRINSSVVLNCASKEYSRTILIKKLAGSMLTLTFKQRKEGQIRSIAIYGKRARGMFVDWFIEKRIEKRDQLTEFNRGGYRYNKDMSSNSELVFLTNL